MTQTTKHAIAWSDGEILNVGRHDGMPEGWEYYILNSVEGFDAVLAKGKALGSQMGCYSSMEVAKEAVTAWDTEAQSGQ